MGLNRSRYLATYLAGKGYETRWGGIGSSKFPLEPTNPFSKSDIEWADVIITARKKQGPLLKENYNVTGKKIICLDVTDSEIIISELYPEYKNLNRKEFNQKWTYPQLEKAIEEYLPLEAGE
jgi:predicted protein tyrosine phosphatase